MQGPEVDLLHTIEDPALEPRQNDSASVSATGTFAYTSSTEQLHPNAGAVDRHHLGQVLAPVIRLRRL